MPDFESRDGSAEDLGRSDTASRSVSDESLTSDSVTRAGSFARSVSDESLTSDSVTRIRSLLDRYREVESDYELLVNVVMDLLRDALDAQGIDFLLVEGRAKAADRVLGKARRPEKHYEDPLRDITDLAGVRVVVRRQADLEPVVDCLRRHFQVDPSRSVDKRDELEEDRFGYRADHHIVRLKEGPDDRPGLADKWAEIQVRTVLEDAWARASRGSLYESAAALPRELRRRFYSLAALLEVADRELEAVLSESAKLIESARRDLAARALDVEIAVPSVMAWLETSSAIRRWAAKLEALGYLVMPSPGPVDHEVYDAKAAGLRTIADLDALFRTTDAWSEEYLERRCWAYDAWRAEIGRRRIKDSNVPIILRLNDIISIALRVATLPDDDDGADIED